MWLMTDHTKREFISGHKPTACDQVIKGYLECIENAMFDSIFKWLNLLFTAKMKLNHNLKIDFWDVGFE